jgi:molecular chaperone GrpE (heat shock protein)
MHEVMAVRDTDDASLDDHVAVTHQVGYRGRGGIVRAARVSWNHR